MNYPDLPLLLRLHDEVIARSGGLAGLRESGVLESILTHIQNDDYYPDFIDKLTHLVYAVNKSHAFHDGNKRTSIAAGAYFLLMNAWERPIVERFMTAMEDIAVEIADNRTDKTRLHAAIMHILLQ